MEYKNNKFLKIGTRPLHVWNVDFSFKGSVSLRNHQYKKTYLRRFKNLIDIAYGVTRERFPSQEIKDKIVASFEKCGVSREELLWIDQNNCNFCDET